LKSSAKLAAVSSAACASRPHAALSPRPNILFFFPDQQRYDWTGTTPGLDVHTPNLVALAERGARFTRAWCPSPLCAPSRACLASGKEYDRCRVASNAVDYPLDQTTMYQLLRDTDYHVMGCGKFDLHKASPTWGLRGDHLVEEWGFSDGIDNAGKWDAINSGSETPRDPYMAYLHERDLASVHVADFNRRRREGGYRATFPTPLPEDAYCDNWVAANGLELLKRSPQGKPWFLQVNFTGPHSPMDITKRMEASARGRRFPQPNRTTQFDAETHNAIRENYTAMVENIDRWVGVYLHELEVRGDLANTVVVYSSDHGEMLGDKDMWGKSKPEQPSVGIPLLMAGPGIEYGVVSSAPVNLVDLTATFLEFGQLSQPIDMEGVSLGPVLRGEQERNRDHMFSGLHNWRAVSDGRHKLIVRIHGQKVPGAAEFADRLARSTDVDLYDLDEDPSENRNLAPETPGIVSRLRGVLLDQVLGTTS